MKYGPDKNRGKHNEGGAQICKSLRSPGIDSKELILPICVAWRADTSNRVAGWESIPGLLSKKVYKLGLSIVAEIWAVICYRFSPSTANKDTLCLPQYSSQINGEQQTKNKEGKGNKHNRRLGTW